MTYIDRQVHNIQKRCRWTLQRASSHVAERKEVRRTRGGEPKWTYSSFLKECVYVLDQDEQKNCSSKKCSNLSRNINTLYSKGLTLPKEIFAPLPLAIEKTTKKPECQRTVAFILWCWGRLLRIPWTAKPKPVNPRGNQPWIFIGKIDAEAEAPILWPPDAKNWFIEKDPDAGKDWRQEEKGTTEDEMIGCYNWFDGHEFE